MYEESIENGGRVERTYLAPDVVYVRGASIARNGVYYNFGDRLGSTNIVTDYKGKVQSATDASGNALTTPNAKEARAFDPYGKPRNADWMSDAGPRGNTEFSGWTQLGLQTTHRGFTQHEHLDDSQLIHMNGRLFDYRLGRFLGVDPIIQFPTNSQSFNPYAYLMNNPLAGTDPTGYMGSFGPGSYYHNLLHPSPFGFTSGAGTNGSTQSTKTKEVWTVDPSKTNSVGGIEKVMEEVTVTAPKPGDSFNCGGSSGSACHTSPTRRADEGPGAGDYARALIFPLAVERGRRGISGSWGDFWRGTAKTIEINQRYAAPFGSFTGPANDYFYGPITYSDNELGAAALWEGVSVFGGVIAGGGVGGMRGAAARPIASPILVTEESLAKSLEGSTMLTAQKSVSLPIVERYIRKLEAGETPPPISVDGSVLVDGNHRFVSGRLFGIEPPSKPGTLPPSQVPLIRPIQELKFDPLDWDNQ
jgi:RHS repeat-associated protein